jgi:hypothetical protein
MKNIYILLLSLTASLSAKMAPKELFKEHVQPHIDANMKKCKNLWCLIKSDLRDFKNRAEPICDSVISSPIFQCLKVSGGIYCLTRGVVSLAGANQQTYGYYVNEARKASHDKRLSFIRTNPHFSKLAIAEFFAAGLLLRHQVTEIYNRILR